MTTKTNEVPYQKSGIPRHSHKTMMALLRDVCQVTGIESPEWVLQKFYMAWAHDELSHGRPVNWTITYPGDDAAQLRMSHRTKQMRRQAEKVAIESGLIADDRVVRLSAVKEAAYENHRRAKPGQRECSRPTCRRPAKAGRKMCVRCTHNTRKANHRVRERQLREKMAASKRDLRGNRDLQDLREQLASAKAAKEALEKMLLDHNADAPTQDDTNRVAYPAPEKLSTLTAGDAAFTTDDIPNIPSTPHE